MKTIYLDHADMPDMPDMVATIGFFDGVHLGHQFLISQVVEMAKTQKRSSMVVTFDLHPRMVLHGVFTPLLTPLSEKLFHLSHTEIDYCVVLSFTAAMAALSARDFMADILSRQLHVKTLFVGYDHHFGHGANDSFEQYAHYGISLGIDVVRCHGVTIDGEMVSSSLIRNCLEKGDVERATRFLGYPYTLIGEVVNGFHQGRKLGFPTANLRPADTDKLLPCSGVYMVKARVEHSMEMKRAVMNIGMRPTFNGNKLSLETHILNYEDDLYGKTLLVYFIHRLREEQKFDTVEDLRHQMQADMQWAIEQFDKESDRIAED